MVKASVDLVAELLIRFEMRVELFQRGDANLNVLTCDLKRSVELQDRKPSRSPSSS